MKTYILVISKNKELSDFFIDFCKKNNFDENYEITIVEYANNNLLEVVFSTCKLPHLNGNSVYIDIYNEVEHQNIEVMTLVKLVDKNMYKSLLEENLSIFNERDIDYLTTNKDVVTNNSVEVIYTKIFFERLFLEGSEVLYNLNKDITAENSVSKTINDYKFALENTEEVFKNPTKIYLQLLDNCTKKCPKCIYNARNEYVPRRDGSEIDFRLLKKLFKELSTFEQVPFVEPSFDCEPLMYSKFKEFLQLATEYKIPTHIVTNAMLLSDKNIDMLLDCSEVVNIVISLDAVTQETYKAVQPSGRLSKVEKNIENLISKRGRSKQPAINFCFTEGTKNAKEFPAFLKKWITKVDSISRNNMFGEDDIKKFSSKNFKKPDYGYCFPMYTDIFISSRGEVFNCHQDVLVNDPASTNLLDTSIMDVYKSDKLNKRRDCHAKKEFPNLCINCLEFAVFESTVKKEKDMLVQTFPFHKIYQHK